jgi:hypothetical protein
MTAKDVLLGNGEDLVGRSVRFAGHIWTITQKTEHGSWGIKRFKQVNEQESPVISVIGLYELPKNHGHYAELLPLESNHSE